MPKKKEAKMKVTYNIPVETNRQLAQLAIEDRRNYSAMVTVLIEREYTRRIEKKEESEI